MKQDKWLVIALAWFSIVVGLIWQMFGTPSFNYAPLTLEEKAHFDLMENSFLLQKVLHTSWFFFVWSGTLIVALFGAVHFLTKKYNTHYSLAVLKKYPGNVKALLGLLIGVVWVEHLFAVYYQVYMVPVLRFIPSNYANTMAIVEAVLGGLFWLLIGESGWAGDFSSWRMGVSGKKPEPIKSFAFGVLATVGVYLLIQVVARIDLWIYISVLLNTMNMKGGIHIRDGSGWTLILNMVTTFGLSMIFMYMVMALAPAYIESRERQKRLRIPGLAILGVAVMVLLLYVYGISAWDLGKKDLKEAAGLSGATESSDILMVLRQGPGSTRDTIAQNWPPRDYTSSKAPSALTTEDIEKLRTYLDSHPHSQFTFPALYLLIREYWSRGERGKAAELQYRTSYQVYGQRFNFLPQWQIMPITSENLAYIRGFADEGKWYHSGMKALALGKAFHHFGLLPEAEKWVRKAKERGVVMDASWNDAFLKEPMLTAGVVKGRLLLNNALPKNAKIVLLNEPYAGTPPKKSYPCTDFNRCLVDARALDANGSFSFDHLGSGNYVLAVIVPKESLPISGVKDAEKVVNPPGAITLSAEKPVRDLGVIRISADRSLVEKKIEEKQK